MPNSSNSESDSTLYIVMRILRGSVQAGASDIHLRSGIAPMVRLDGELCPLDHAVLESTTIIRAMTAFVNWAGVQSEYGKTDQLDFACEVPDVGRFRIHCYRQRGTQAIVMRHIPTPIPEFSSLRMPPVIKTLAQAESGLLLVTSGAGHGKSTTLASILNYINRHAPKHIVTLEHPIEFLFDDDMASFSQREIGRDIETTLQGLQAARREDADCIFVSNLQTRDEIEAALQIAESGKLVVGGLTAPHIGACITQLVQTAATDNEKTFRNRLAGNIVGMLAQHLLPSKNGPERILATEALVRTRGIADCLRDPARQRTLYTVLDKNHRDHGTHSFDSQVLRMLGEGQINKDAARSIAHNPTELMRMHQ